MEPNILDLLGLLILKYLTKKKWNANSLISPKIIFVFPLAKKTQILTLSLCSQKSHFTK